MSFGFAFALLLTLHRLQLVSTQTSSPLNGNVTPIFAEIPDSSKPESAVSSPEDNLNSLIFSGDEELNAQHDNMNETLPDQTTTKMNEPTAINNDPSILDNSTNSPVEPNQQLENLTTVGSNENLPQNTSTTSSSPGNSITNAISTQPVFNSNLTTTSSSENGNYTNSSSENSTDTATLSQFHTTPENINTAGELPDARANTINGLSSDTTEQETKQKAWAVILGIGVTVAIVATVIYMITKRRNYRDFSHRKLVEDVPNGPVLRLDNSEPLDLKFDGFAYYNPGLQGDNIQMTNFPKGHTN